MTKDALPTQDEAVAEIKKKGVVSLWPTVAVVLGMSRGSVYAAAQRGDIEIIKVGRLKKTVSAPLRRRLGIYPARQRQHWQYWSITRALRRLGARPIGRAGGIGRPGIWVIGSKSGSKGEK